jgi:hypothetical protein
MLALGNVYVHINKYIYIGICAIFLGSVALHCDMCHFLGIPDSVLEDDMDPHHHHATWTIPRGHTCFLGPFLEVLRRLEHIFLRVDSFRGSYLLTECPKFQDQHH